MIETLCKVNILKNRYVTDGNIWTIDETFFIEDICLFLVTNLKTRAILGYILGHKESTSIYITELYEQILLNYKIDQKPIIIHSDLKENYYKPKEIINFLKEHEIQTSLASGAKHQNQVSESINDKIKYETVLHLLNKDSRPLRNLIKIQPSVFKYKNKKTKAKSKAYRKWIFTTDFFKNNFFETIPEAIKTYNEREFSAGISRKNAEFFNTKIKGKNLEDIHLVKSSDQLANQIKQTNIIDFNQVKNKLVNILNDNSDTGDKLLKIQELVIEGQNSTQEILKVGFTGLALQNAQLIESNEELSLQLTDLQNKFNSIVEELNFLKSERQEKLARKEARLKRKTLPRRQPITPEIYELLIKAVTGNNYQAARLRIALCLLTVTGIRINELLPLKVEQLTTLIQNHWIAINRSKRGPSSHKAFLTPEGKRFILARQKDFELIFCMKEPDSYVFTSDSNHYKSLRRESITRSVNKITRIVALEIPGQPNITSHSFRIGYISQLWRDIQDIEFVRQAVGHIKVESTSSYVENLSDQERQKRMLEINSIKP